MITAERKPFEEILALLDGKDQVLVAGCETCVAVCLTGGEKEAEILASELRIKAKDDGRELKCEHTAAIRQCEWEYLDMIAEKVAEYPVVISMACGIGIQSMAEKFSRHARAAGRQHQHARHASGARRLARALRRLRRLRPR